MKISYNWLKQYVDFQLSPNDLAEVLTGIGLEVESVIPFESLVGGLEGVVVGEIKECSKHPDADKLSVTKVDVAQGELLQIVCGAPNVAAGQKVLVALVGSTLYPAVGEKLQIKKAKIRGVESYGMICAEDELGLGQSHEGIMILPVQTAVGTQAAHYFKLEKDYTLEIGLTPNRGDAFSHIGVARDLVAALNVSYHAPVSLTLPETYLPKATDLNDLSISVEVKDTEACPRYSGLTMSGITVAESPEWLKNKLKAIGVKPVNNVVDVTNYVLHEYGQPLHAFDADKITGGKIIVQKLAAGTLFRTLDDREVKLQADDLMICNDQNGMCIAGVYGGKESGVSNRTTKIFIESAYFNPTGIRRTSSHHNLRTDAAMHYEKGCDPNITITALQRVASLISEIGGGQITSDVLDIYPQPIQDIMLEVDYQRLMRRAGFEIEKKIVREILHHLAIHIEKEDGDKWTLQIPPFKTDVSREADVLEEILRIYGYNSFALPGYFKTGLSTPPAVDVVKLQNGVAEMLAGAGLHEIWTNSVSQSDFEWDADRKQQLVKLLNHQSAELDSLRTSMLYSGLEVIAYNSNRKQNDLRLFEFGTTYHLLDSGYQQQKHLALWFCGQTFEDNWIGKSEQSNFYQLKTSVLQVLHRLGHYHFEKEYREQTSFDFSLSLKNEDVEIAHISKVSTKVLRHFHIKQEVFYAELNWDYLLEKSQFHQITFRELPKYPSVRRDLALVVSEDLSFSAIEKTAFAISKKLLKDISLFDVYQGEKIADGKKSYAISLVFQHPDKTLTDEEIEKVMKRLMKIYETEFGAVIRQN